MTRAPFRPTEEQNEIIRHDGSAFITACPGAGKTRVMVERTREVLGRQEWKKALAFISFTRAAVSELQARLVDERLILSPPFPHFVGTFDSFIWSFFLAPFGIPGTAAVPRLMPDLDERAVQPYRNAQPLPLSTFSRVDGRIDVAEARKLGFRAEDRARDVPWYERAAVELRARFRNRGELDFEDVRAIVMTRLADQAFSERVGPAVSARFGEFIIDEAQDCSRDDLTIIDWLRRTGPPIKVVCDPQQSIYGFRGGVTAELLRYHETFPEHERLHLTGNFRSSQSVCAAISLFRPAADRGEVDRAVGEHANDATPIHILSYNGAVSPGIGRRFSELIEQYECERDTSPILAKTAMTCTTAAGQSQGEESGHPCIRLASAVCRFHHAADGRARLAALEAAHRTILGIEGHLKDQSYHEYLAETDQRSEEWRPRISRVLGELRYDPAHHPTAAEWLARARELLEPGMLANIGTIGQRLRYNAALANFLVANPGSRVPARSIHSAKGLEFPAVCVVLTSTAGPIFDFLENGEPQEKAEAARELYVAVSRAKKLLVVAARQAQAIRLRDALQALNVEVHLEEIVE